MNWEDILLAVEKPSRYTGGEVNAVKKDRRACELSVALAFPDTYEVGMSHLGLQILYAILNQHPRILAERCYAPWPDMERQMRRHGLPLKSLESHTPLHRFDIVGFSLQYELSYTNVLNMLDLGGVPLPAADRSDGHPFVIAGGPCAFHPAPMARFIDVFVIGEGEEVISEVALAVLDDKRSGRGRPETLQRLAGIAGVYCPAVHTAAERIKKRVIPDINAWPFPLRPVVPLMQTIHNRATIEIARGCTRGCRFCQAGMVWRPVRERHPAGIELMAEEMLCSTGHHDLSLLSLSSGDYSRIEPLLASLMDRYHGRRIALALPSLRVETLTRSLMEEIKRVRKTSFTLAPEAGTQRLRDVINKGNSEADLLATTEQVFAAGWKSLKLYFMLGLPGETQADMDGIADLAHQVLREARHRGQVTVSLSTFVPKPHTPFQWAGQIGLAETREKQDYFKRRLRGPNLHIKWHDARMSLLEGLLARGDETMGLLIERAFQSGCRFDGWSDHFRFDLWEQAMTDLAIRPDAELGERRLTDRFPWDRIDCGLSRHFLTREWRKSIQGELTADCRMEPCHLCGVCDHRTVKMISAADSPPLPADDVSSTDDSSPGKAAFGPLKTVQTGGLTASRGQIGAGNRFQISPPEKRLRIEFTKLGPSRFLSHLELSAALIRAVHQSGLTFVYSQGFHPLPKISFAFATAVGMESYGEYADIQIKNSLSDSMPIGKMNAFLPEGMVVKSLREIQPYRPSLSEEIRGFQYHLCLPDAVGMDRDATIAGKLEQFLASATFTITRKAKEKTVVKDIRALVMDLRLDPKQRRIELHVACKPAGLVRPADILTKVCGFDEDMARGVRIIKKETFFR
ncbi:MAG: TIGR03960 family B12-binding radical SAM protein [Pseudomonadota bacterium]